MCATDNNVLTTLVSNTCHLVTCHVDAVKKANSFAWRSGILWYFLECILTLDLLLRIWYSGSNVWTTLILIKFSPMHTILSSWRELLHVTGSLEVFGLFQLQAIGVVWCWSCPEGVSYMHAAHRRCNGERPLGA